VYAQQQKQRRDAATAAEVARAAERLADDLAAVAALKQHDAARSGHRGAAAAGRVGIFAAAEKNGRNLTGKAAAVRNALHASMARATLTAAAAAAVAADGVDGGEMATIEGDKDSAVNSLFSIKGSQRAPPPTSLRGVIAAEKAKVAAAKAQRRAAAEATAEAAAAAARQVGSITLASVDHYLHLLPDNSHFVSPFVPHLTRRPGAVAATLTPLPWRRWQTNWRHGVRRATTSAFAGRIALATTASTTTMVAAMTALRLWRANGECIPDRPALLVITTTTAAALASLQTPTRSISVTTACTKITSCLMMRATAAAVCQWSNLGPHCSCT
jgi:hypothetical protein